MQSANVQEPQDGNGDAHISAENGQEDARPAPEQRSSRTTGISSNTDSRIRRSVSATQRYSRVLLSYEDPAPTPRGVPRTLPTPPPSIRGPSTNPHLSEPSGALVPQDPSRDIQAEAAPFNGQYPDVAAFVLSIPLSPSTRTKLHALLVDLGYKAVFDIGALAERFGRSYEISMAMRDHRELGLDVKDLMARRTTVGSMAWENTMERVQQATSNSEMDYFEQGLTARWTKMKASEAARNGDRGAA